MLPLLLAALAAPAPAWARDVEVVVGLEGPGLAQARAQSRVLETAEKRRRLDVRAPDSVAYLHELTRRQIAFARRLQASVPSARVRWRYRVVLNGLAVVLPERRLPRLARLPGVRTVFPSATYRLRLDRSPSLIGAPTLWGPGLTTAGQGVKIGILDDGIDQTHPFFSPAGYTAPLGFPKGHIAFTTAKVVVARAFPPPTTRWRNAGLPFDAVNSSHGTHVAGIAAGNAGTIGPGGTSLSGVAPRAYLGNYKVLTVPTENFGLNGNAPEIAAAVEAAVADGMDVINLSLGEPEIEPSRDLLALALDGAAAAGVVPVAAAGNDFGMFGRGSVGSPGSSAGAITVGAITNRRNGSGGGLAGFSAAGPTPVSLRLKPDVLAPGASVLSSLPAASGELWAILSGTSMAAPHVAGGAALLRQRHPDWTVAQLKSALVDTGTPLEAPVVRTGGGLVDLPDANAPLIFTEPSSVSFGLLQPGRSAERKIRLEDAGGGAGRWQLRFETSVSARDVIFATNVEGGVVPGELELGASVARGAPEQDVEGFVVLSRGSDVRRIPFWFRIESPRLPPPNATLRRPGTYTGSTVGRPARVSSYRYPERPGTEARGPEQVFRVVLTKPVANFGAVVLSGAVEPRVVEAGDENRLTGYAGLPLDINPYAEGFGRGRPVAGALRPAPGAYDLVFDSPGRTGSRFRFRFWINDVAPPTARLLSPVARGGILRVRVADGGSGIDPSSVQATVGSATLGVRIVRGVALVLVSSLPRGTHLLRFHVSDYQEAKNNENTPRILPNTRQLTVRFRVF